MFTACLLVLTVHFGVILAGKIYRAQAPLHATDEQLQTMLQRPDDYPIDWKVRAKVFVHGMLAS